MRHLVATALVLSLLGIAAPAHAGVKVVATVPDLAAITKQIGGKKVSVTALSLPTQDPHFVDAKPSIVLKLNKADLLIAVGLDLEVGWLPALQTQARNKKILSSGSGYLECASVVDVKDAATGAVDRSSGDVHPAGNPHYLYDPRQAARCATAIADKLIAADAGNAKLYRANLAAFLADLDEARAGWEQRMAPYQGQAVVTYHASMTYLVDWLGLEAVATLEPLPGVPPTARHVASVIKTGKAKGAKLVLQEAYYPAKTGKLVARKLGGSCVVLDGGASVAKGERYRDRMDEVIDDLVRALQ